jgi:hypothetical protein
MVRKKWHRRLGWRWAVLVVGRSGNEVSIVIRSATGDTVSVTSGHAGEGKALLAELRSVVGREEGPDRAMFRT